jgi:beta-lactamase regulating signal transducer with metallopeptidase domain
MDIVRLSLLASLLVLVVVMLRMTVGVRLPKITFRLLWGAVIVALLIPINIPSNLSIFNLFERVAEPAYTENTVPSNPTNEVSVFHYARPPIVQESPSVQGNYETVVEHESGSLTFADYIYLPLMIVSIAIFLVVLISHFKHRREYSTSLPCEDKYVLNWVESHKLLFRKYSVRTLDKVTSPLTYGLFKPVIILPSTIDFDDAGQINCILYHELTHIKRFDVLWKFVSLVALAVHWFNPLVWAMYVLLNRDIELSCDEKVVKHIGEKDKSRYAEMLIDLTQKRRAPFLLVNAFSKNLTKERVNSIMRFRKTTLGGIVLSIAVVAVTLTVFATSPPQQTAAEVMGDNGEVVSIAPTETEGVSDLQETSGENSRVGDITNPSTEQEQSATVVELQGLQLQDGLIQRVNLTPTERLTVEDFRPCTPAEIERGRSNFRYNDGNCTTTVFDRYGNVVLNDRYGNIVDAEGNILEFAYGRTLDENGNVAWIPADGNVMLTENVWWEWNGSEWELTMNGNWELVNGEWKEMR